MTGLGTRMLRGALAGAVGTVAVDAVVPHLAHAAAAAGTLCLFEAS